MGKVNNFVPRGKSRDLSKIGNLGGVGNTPCTVAEAAQIAFAAARDTVEGYTADVNKVVIQQTLMINTLKDLLIQKGVFTEEEFSDEYTAQATRYNEEKKEYLESLLRKKEEGGDTEDGQEAKDSGSD